MISASSGDLYSFFGNNKPWSTALSATTSNADVWHRRLGHPSPQVTSSLAAHDFLPSCNKIAHTPCNACQLGRQPRLPFPHSHSRTFAPFELIHCDLWTSPVVSFSSYKYYLIVLDDYTHFSWSFPLRNKSDTSLTLQRFFSYVRTQYNVIIKALQCDNGGEFINSDLRSLFSTNGIVYRFSCPHTSPQNGKAERLLRTTNDIVRTLLIQAKLTPPFWVEALHTATYLLNRLPTKALAAPCPFSALFSKPTAYTLLRTFSCLCYPNLTATMPHKLSHRSAVCVFLGYPSNHRGYRCMDIESRRIIISHHVIFDKTRFPFTPNFSVSNMQQHASTPPSDDGPIDILDSVVMPPMHVGLRPSAG